VERGTASTVSQSKVANLPLKRKVRGEGRRGKTLTADDIGRQRRRHVRGKEGDIGDIDLEVLHGAPVDRDWDDGYDVTANGYYFPHSWERKFVVVALSLSNEFAMVPSDVLRSRDVVFNVKSKQPIFNLVASLKE
jgi:hypothetical protein